MPKSGDSSLHDWFSKSKSSDGKPGWVQLGGKYAGKPCAKQPGQTTKPKCGSSKMKRELSKDEEERAFRRKNRQDPNPERSGKAINVATEETQIDEKCWVGYKQVGMKKKGKKMVPNCVPEEKDHEYSMVRSQLSTVMSAAKRLKKKMGKGEGNVEAWVQSKITKASDYLDSAADYVDSGEMNEEEGKKDACYHKVKSRYKVWPSAYASGALVKCRKKGAKNWGTKSEQNGDFLYDWESPLDGAKRYCPKCQKDEYQNECKYGPKFWALYSTPIALTSNQMKYDIAQLHPANEEVSEAIRFPAVYGNIISIIVAWRGKTYVVKMFFPNAKMPTRREVKDQIEKVYPGATVMGYEVSKFTPGEPLIQVTEDWQKVNKQDKTDGMSPAAVKAYRRENPGSKLKTAVTGDPKPGSKDAKRRANYCSRSKGQQNMHNIDCSKTPDKPICKARKRWKC